MRGVKARRAVSLSKSRKDVHGQICHRCLLTVNLREIPESEPDLHFLFPFLFYSLPNATLHTCWRQK